MKIKGLIVKGVIAGIVLFIAIQFVPYGKDHSNPPVIAEPPWDQPETREFFVRACADCHSNETHWPWYSNFAPASWLVTMDINEGREHFNVSEWDPQNNMGGWIAKQVELGEMPPLKYLLPHPEARLTDEEKAKFINGLKNTFGR
ncbi:heme-binding domain-containing protein [uncultured Desulfuromusa sp.]|uniref:heme-binding domain-containing protein n=1 Tax=uncultured Desulfuromusa sp. TaxID=219183 RepID=UPI002AA86644|nr:heme-binding domain-containing protein [uncultured Desulfuromusa sp.]